MKKVNEIDLMLYCLCIEMGYFELLELYGVLFSYSKCPKCGHASGMHFKVIKDIISSFGGVVSGIKIPTLKELNQVSRDITIWKGLQGIQERDFLAERVSEYAKRFELTNDAIYRIKRKINSMIEKFAQMKKVFRQYGNRTNSK
jgi:ABC-type Na+ transport system ATPase subunit NatA